VCAGGRAQGALALALHAISLLAQRRLIDDVEQHRKNAQLVVLPPPCPLHTQPIDFNHAHERIDRALTDARKFLDGGGEERPPIRMRVRRHGSATTDLAQERDKAARDQGAERAALSTSSRGPGALRARLGSTRFQSAQAGTVKPAARG
jgi:hypothetical protein